MSGKKGGGEKTILKSERKMLKEIRKEKKNENMKMKWEKLEKSGTTAEFWGHTKF